MADIPLGTRLFLGIDKACVRYTGGSLFMKVFSRRTGIHKNPNFKPAPPILLLTKGRKTGKTRSAVLPMFEVDGVRFVVGSKGGMPKDPAWVSNLRQEPNASLFLHRRRHQVRLRSATAGERARLWPKLIADHPVYQGYQRQTSREIPLVLIEFETA